MVVHAQDAASHIMRALPDMFSYTRHPNMPKTSNSIESFFGQLKDNLRLHRGLSNEHFNDFVKWYLFLQSNQGIPGKKTGRKQFCFLPVFIYPQLYILASLPEIIPPNIANGRPFTWS